MAREAKSRRLPNHSKECFDRKYLLISEANIMHGKLWWIGCLLQQPARIDILVAQIGPDKDGSIRYGGV